MASSVRIADGQFDFSQGVDSSRVPTLESPLNPNGLKRNQLAWMSNCTVREGGVRARTGWKRIKHLAKTGLFQGGAIYSPEFANPYLICSISGRIYKVLLDSPYTVTDLSATFGLINPATVTQAYFCQADQFLIIQAGDWGTAAVPTLPLFWDGTNLWRSPGITNTAVAAGTPGVNFIPAATAMDYYQGRLWYAQGKSVMAGDIIYGSSGTAAYGFRNAVLNVTESPAAVGGDGFSVASSAGDIRALGHTANYNNTLGDSELYIFTRKTVYALSVPLTRSDWIAATTSNLPQQRIVQRTNGTVSDRSLIAINGDLFYASTDGIRTIRTVLRGQNQWGNIPISVNIIRATERNDLGIMRTCSGVQFDNRMLMLQLPRQTTSGVVFDAVAALDFNVISTLQEQLPPAWEGTYEGLQFMQLWEGDFGGRPRAFGMILSSIDGTLEVWELTAADKFDNQDATDDRRINWWFETPRYTWASSQQELELKQLIGGEIWLDKILGTVQLTVEYRVDSDPCWKPWAQFERCYDRGGYPGQTYREGDAWSVTLPKPPHPTCNAEGNRPSDQGFAFQARVTINGWCRVCGFIMYGIHRDRSPYQNMGCV